MNNHNQKFNQKYQAKYDETRPIVIRYRYIKRSTARDFVENALLSIGIVCLLSTAFLGIGALGCWGIEKAGGQGAGRQGESLSPLLPAPCSNSSLLAECWYVFQEFYVVPC